MDIDPSFCMTIRDRFHLVPKIVTVPKLICSTYLCQVPLSLHEAWSLLQNYSVACGLYDVLLYAPDSSVKQSDTV